MDFEDLEEKQMYYISSDGEFVGVYFVVKIYTDLATVISYKPNVDKRVLMHSVDKEDFGYDVFGDSIKMTRVHASSLNKEIRMIIKKIFELRPGALKEGLPFDMGDEIDTPQNVTKKNRFNKLLKAIKDNDTLAMTYIVNEFPRIQIGYTLDKLKKRRSKYKKYPGYDVAVSKLEWRRSH